jgi:hypothetical protein
LAAYLYCLSYLVSKYTTALKLACVPYVVDHLVKLWEDQLKGYDVEEQGLRAMLDAAVVERTKSETSQDKKILAEWETLLFGKREAYSSFYKVAEQDADAFVALRYENNYILINRDGSHCSGYIFAQKHCFFRCKY